MDPRLTDIPGAEPQNVVATYNTYAEAQLAVDHLSDAGFPVEHTAIVGLDLRIVERVTGRLTNVRAAMAGAASGAWFGLFTTGPEWIGLMIGGLLIGAFWGALFGFFAHWATRGERDFASASRIVADRYELRVTDAHAARARELLAQL